MTPLITENIREEFKHLIASETFVTDKTGVKTVEILNACFIADESVIFGTVNQDWNERELAWYKSLSLNVNDIPPPIPEIWKKVADANGYINSNYGWCVHSKENGFQYLNVLRELQLNPDSRRANMIYNRPSMWIDYNKDGRSDFMCTNNVQYAIRDNQLVSMVSMRSNDALYGFKGDKHWQDVVHKELLADLQLVYPTLTLGKMFWNSSSLHIYERHFPLVK